MIATAEKIYETEVMIIDHTAYPRWQFEDLAERGFFSASVTKRGWRPTHIERITSSKTLPEWVEIKKHG